MYIFTVLCFSCRRKRCASKSLANEPSRFISHAPVISQPSELITPYQIDGTISFFINHLLYFSLSLSSSCDTDNVRFYYPSFASYTLLPAAVVGVVHSIHITHRANSGNILIRRVYIEPFALLLIAGPTDS